MEDDKNVAKITLTYEDGTDKVIDKGFVAQFNGEGDQLTMTFDMAGIKGEDLRLIVVGVMQLGMKLGFFGEDEKESFKQV
ncbi:MAG: hypothetical protein VB018_09480 [Lachnospiraceae bacterium]|nr:hypothetical protein [Lachnospiraceae bacterium]